MNLLQIIILTIGSDVFTATRVQLWLSFLRTKRIDFLIAPK